MEAGKGKVHYEAVNGTAKAGLEFVATSGVLIWGENEGQV